MDIIIGSYFLQILDPRVNLIIKIKDIVSLYQDCIALYDRTF